MSAMLTMNIKQRFQVSIRALAEFCLSTGHLVSQYRASASALEGQQVHRRVQNALEEAAQTEVTVKFDWIGPQHILSVVGRIDSVLASGVEEIKASRIPPSELPASAQQLHRLQAELYAACVASEINHEKIIITLRYVHPQTDQSWPVTFTRTRVELIEQLVHACSRFDHWLSLGQQQRQRRQVALQALKFPYPTMRDSQRQMAESVYKSAVLKRHATIEAPTGTGKSLAALFPALKATLQQPIDTVFYLTMKNTGQASARKAIEQLDPTKQLTVVQLQAKEKLCLAPDTPCDGEFCPFASHYFAKRERVREQLFAGRHWWIEQSKALGEQEQICPYYLNQDWAVWADVIVGDINYIYDTTAVQPLLLKEIKNNATVLIDEAHNLISRGRVMYSTALVSEHIQTLAKHCPKSIKDELNKIQRAIREVCKDATSDFVETPPTTVLNRLKDFIARSATLLREAPFFSPPIQWQNFLFEASRFIRLHELANSADFAWRYTSGTPDQRVIELACLNPSNLLLQKHNLVNNVVAFSATLKPMHYSNRLNGLNDSVFVDLPSPFQKHQYDAVVIHDVSTRFRDRMSLPDRLQPLLEAVIRNQNNSMVFFSSYQQLMQCTEPLHRPSNNLTYVQRNDWTQTERDDMLERFAEQRGITLFAVLGGVFSEGVDLPGEALTEVIVVGPGLPQVNALNKTISDRLNSQTGQGFELTYTYPGLQKTLQAAGRAVRTETDHGHILLIDDRFYHYWQKGLLPSYWSIQTMTLDHYYTVRYTSTHTIDPHQS